MKDPEGDESSALVRRHLAVGWIGLSVGVALGIALEALHAFKVPLYLDVGSSATRLMWRLAHAHLGLLSLTSLGFAFTLTRVPGDWRRTSRWLLWGSALLPTGFFVAGFGAHGGDPGWGIALVPLGAAALLIACVRAALQVLKGRK